MNLPKKIYPDRIKDAILEIRFSSSIPHEVALGIFYNSLDDTYEYLYRPLPTSELPLAIPSMPSREISLSLGAISLFSNEFIKFEIRENSIIFNCNSKYPGWDIYLNEINKVFSQIEEPGIIEKINRVGIRYISEYQELKLTDISKITFSFGMPEVKSEIVAFRSEFTRDDFLVILNLNEGYYLPLTQTGEAHEKKKLSKIDIDVIWEQSIDYHRAKLTQIIDNAHTKEKEIFFSVLNEKFLATLNAEYK